MDGFDSVSLKLDYPHTLDTDELNVRLSHDNIRAVLCTNSDLHAYARVGIHLEAIYVSNK